MRAANYLEEQGEITNQDGLLLPGTSEFLRKSPMKNFIAGRWSDAQGGQPHKVIDPSTGSLLDNDFFGYVRRCGCCGQGGEKGFPGLGRKIADGALCVAPSPGGRAREEAGRAEQIEATRCGKGGGECRSV